MLAVMSSLMMAMAVPAFATHDGGALVIRETGCTVDGTCRFQGLLTPSHNSNATQVIRPENKNQSAEPGGGATVTRGDPGCESETPQTRDCRYQNVSTPSGNNINTIHVRPSTPRNE